MGRNKKRSLKKKAKFRKNKKRSFRFLLLLLLFCITVGYASLNTNLNINGTSSINNPRWDIHFENIQVTPGSVAPTSAATISLDTVVNFAVPLAKPGDFYEFTVDVKNDGTIDGMISGITSKLNGTTITTLPDYLEYYVTYVDGLEILNNHLLAVNEKETYKVHIGYKDGLQDDQLPTTDQSFNLSFGVSYVQSTDAAQPVNHAIDKYTVTLNQANDTTYSVRIGQAIPANITQYNTNTEALAALRTATNDNSVNFYLKHTVQNGVVIASYVEFIITPDVAIANPGLTAGTFAIQGAGSTYVSDGDYYMSDSIYYDNNKQTLLNSFGEDYCLPEYMNNEMQCIIPNLSPYIFRFGSVSVVGNQVHCEVLSDGSSNCAYNNF